MYVCVCIYIYIYIYIFIFLILTKQFFFFFIVTVTKHAFYTPVPCYKSLYKSRVASNLYTSLSQS